jgi:ABC-type phosphate transport system substrate-binding protein
MRNLTRLTAAALGAAAFAAATLTSLATAPALADPPPGTTPRPCDVVGIGDDSADLLFDQFSHDFNGQQGGNPQATCAVNPIRYLYSWDAAGGPIVPKQGCPQIPRSAGISVLGGATTGGFPCVDFLRSARDRTPATPPSVSFITLAGDAITYATQPNSNAPTNLTTAQLTAIYNCIDTNWSQVGGKNAPIHAFLPQAGSLTRAFFLTAIGLTTPGPCVSDDNGMLMADEGVNPVLNTSKPDVIVPYAVSKYIAQRYHSAKCLNSACTPNGSGVVCTPSGGQNLFGCDTRGTMVLNEINGTAPTEPFPLTSTTKNPVINPRFSAAFTHLLFDVVESPAGTIPAYLQPYFGPSGWTCTNATARKDLRHYGLLALPAGTAPGDCGSAH